ncbi:MAG: response regulator [Alphaproteobacteria bacterium]|nr:response regulator [Alphaproteobacteria bacterium]
MTEVAAIHVIDDDAAVRDSLTFLLDTAGLPVIAHDSARHFLEAAAANSAGCIVADVRMPEIDGLQLLRHLSDRGIETPVIVITGHGDIPLAVSAMKAGAVDFIEKPFDDEVLLRAVRTALDRGGQRATQNGMLAELSARLETLSSRERQVFDGIVAGRPNKVIAHELGISPRTVEVYRSHVMTKMQAETLPDLVRMATQVQSA